MLVISDVFEILSRVLSELEEHDEPFYDESDELDDEVLEALERDDAIRKDWRREKQTRCFNRKQHFRHSREFRGTYKAQKAWHSWTSYNHMEREFRRAKDEKVDMKRELDEYFYDRKVQEEMEQTWAEYEEERRLYNLISTEVAWFEHEHHEQMADVLYLVENCLKKISSE